MDPQLLSIHYSDPLWVAIAFLFGLCVNAIKLPPMVGFLIAGFVLSALGAESGEFLNAMADLGITLLLFSIGLKLKLKSLARPEVWGVATIHMAFITLFISGIIWLLTYSSIGLLANLTTETALLIGFAMSFSSTVFAVKILDELGATSAKHGRIAIGVLVVQDIAAVLFIAFSIGKVPSPWALLLIGLYPARFVLFKILDKVGHGELLILFGITVALAGADLFELVGIKGDVGALVFGMLFANHPKTSELAKALLGFKELFLIGFFLSVGMMGLPTWSDVLIGLLFILFLPIKAMLFYTLFTAFQLRASTAWRTAFNLASFSEFGLIVGALVISTGWLPEQWLAVFAVMMTASFILTAPLVNIRDQLYNQWRPFLKRFERAQKITGDESLLLTQGKVVIVGMGRMGTAVYSAIEADYAEPLVGIESDREKVKRHKALGKNVVAGDATNPDFWVRAPWLINSMEWVLLTLPTHNANMNAAIRLKELGYVGHIGVATKYLDEEVDLKELGVDHTFNIYTEAGMGFANELQTFMKK